MPTLEEIGKATKAKYPEYQGKSDLEVGKAVVAKYPEYQSRVTPSDTRSGYQKAVDTIPDIFQLVGNVVATPFGKPARVAAGATTRAAGESVRQALSPETSSIGDAYKIIQGLLQGKSINEQILSPEEQRAAEYKLSKEGAASQLQSLGSQAALGAGTTAVGEYVIGPTISKTGQIISSGVSGTKNLISRMFPKASAFVSGVGREAGEGVKTVLGQDQIRAANELWGLDNAKGVVKTYQEYHPGKDISKQAIDITKKVLGNTEQEIADNLTRESTKTGMALNDALNKAKGKVDLRSMSNEITKAADSLRRLGADGAEQADKLLANYQSIVSANKGIVDKATAHDLLVTIREQLFSPSSGKATPAKPLSQGLKKSYEILAKNLNDQIKSGLDKATLALFDEYGAMQALKKTIASKLAGLPGMPEVGANTSGFSAITNFLTKGYRTPEYLQAVIQNTPSSAAPVINAIPPLASKTLETLKATAPAAAATYINPRLQSLQRAIDAENNAKRSNRVLP